jgi:glutamate-1-semialdehyde 2,1-aminomutase
VTARSSVGSERFARSRSLQERARRVIPGGAHTYAKGDDQYPEQAPGFIARGEGCRIWDVDGNEYIEYAMGLRAVTLGHAFPEVVQAAQEEMQRGSNFNRPAPIELEYAEALVELLPAADMVKFTKDGSTANTAAVKLARAFTGRPLVALCVDQPFFSYDDWAMVVTPLTAGIPPGVEELTVTFRYNDIGSVERLFEAHPDSIACVILEAEKGEPPRDGFLHRVCELCTTSGTLFVLDEMITGFRWDLPGAQTLYGLEPDLSTFGKAMANGFALSALAGRREIMERGGLESEEERVFLLSTTHGAETASLAAALATMEVYREQDVIGHLYRQGERLREGVESAIDAAGVRGHFTVGGRACCLVYGTRDQDGNPSQDFRALFLQETIARGVLAPSLIVSHSHDDEAIDETVDAIAGALDVYAKALEDGVERYLDGRPVKPVYRRFN